MPVDPPNTQTDNKRDIGRWLPWVLLAAVSIGVSVSIGTTFDEAIWVAVGRKALDGHALYSEAIDHKTPFILLLAGGLDLLPAEFAIARGVLVGCTVTVVGFLAAVTAKALGLERNNARAVGLVIGASAALQTVFTLTVELLAVVALLGALASSAKSWYRTAGVFGALSAFIDIRVALLGIGLLALSRERGGRRGLRRTAATALPIGLTGLGLIVLLPDARFGILEMSLASRENPWRLLSQTAVGLRALLFLAVAFWLVIRPSRASLQSLTWNNSAVLLIMPAVVLAFLSRLDFDHYWLLVLPSAPVLAAQISSDRSSSVSSNRPSEMIAVLLIAVSLLPALFHTVRIIRVYQSNGTRVEHAADYLTASLGKGGTFVKFGDRAFLAALLPDRYEAPSPVMHYYVLETSRQERARAELQRSIDRAAVIVDEGELEVESDRVFSHVRPVHRIFIERLVDFPCVRSRDGYVFHFRADMCPAT